MKSFAPSYTFTSRYGQTRSITRVDDHRFIVEGDTRYMRGGEAGDGGTMVDFEGGPFLMSGESLQVCVGDFPCVPENAVIKRVRCVTPYVAATEMGFTDSAMIKAFDKSDYSYVLVETM